MPLDLDGDLFDLANSLAGLVGAPITIEDRDTIVLAYSGGQQDVDEARIGTILGRQVPVHYRDAIAATGVFERIRTSDEVIVVDLPEEQMVARAVIAVRNENHLIGSIWAAIPGGPSAAQEEILRAAAPVVATQLRAENDRANRGRRERVDLVSTLIRGGAEAESLAVARSMSGPFVVVTVRGTTEDLAHQAAGPLTLHLSAVAPAALSAPLPRGLYGVLPTSAPRILGDFLNRFGGRADLAVGIGTPADHATDLQQSRQVADQVADALQRRGRLGQVATLEDVLADVLVDQLEGFLNQHPDASPLTRLAEHDRLHKDAGLVDAVRTFLDTGEVSAAAEVLVVHPNTIRNRLRRAREQCGVDVGDPAIRLVLMIDLRVVR